MRLHFVLVQTISLLKFKLSIRPIITVEIFYAFYTYDNSYDGPLLSYGLERFICSRSDDVGDDVLFSVRLSVVSQILHVCSVGYSRAYSVYR